MRHIIILVAIATLFSCCKNKTKQKELELKEKELALKEKELSLKYKDTATSKKNSTDTVALIPKVITENKIELPFTGTKYFNFNGGNGTEESITITKDGMVILKSYSAPVWGEEIYMNVYYKGKYSKFIKIYKDGGYKIEGNKIYSVNTKGVVETGCQGDEIPCVSNLY